MARSKINKRSIPHDPKKARCERRLCFNLKSVDGRILSPKKALESLRERRDDIFVSLLNNFDEDLVQENIVLREEMSICEAFLDKEGKRQRCLRARLRLKNCNNFLILTQDEEENKDEGENEEERRGLGLRVPSVDANDVIKCLQYLNLDEKKKVLGAMNGSFSFESEVLLLIPLLSKENRNKVVELLAEMISEDVGGGCLSVEEEEIVMEEEVQEVKEGDDIGKVGEDEEQENKEQDGSSCSLLTTSTPEHAETGIGSSSLSKWVKGFLTSW